MSFKTANPSAFLSQYVKQYWSIENCVSKGNEYLYRIVPYGMMELMFYIGDKPGVTDKEKSISENTILSGQQYGYYDLIISGTLSIFSVSFRPHGAMMFFDIPLNEFYNKNTPLKHLLKEKFHNLETELYEAESFNDRVKVVENYLIYRLQKNTKKYEAARINRSVELINKSRGIIGIDFLASQVCLCRKQFERTFLEYIGLSPKQFLNIVRFQSSIYRKQQNNKIQLTSLAYDSGYYDQSHMIKDYKLLSGKTPKQYFEECDAYSDYFE